MVMLAVCIILVVTNSGKGIFYVAIIIAVVVVGLVFVTTISYYRKKRQRLRASVWKRLRQLMAEAREEEARKRVARVRFNFYHIQVSRHFLYCPTKKPGKRIVVVSVGESR